MSYTPVELRHVRVGRSLFGYNRAMVEQIIEEVAQSFEVTWRERGELIERVEAQDKQLGDLRQREALLANTLVAAERTAADVRERAKREADAIVTEARNEAREVARSARAEQERLLAETRKIEAMLRGALAVLGEAGESVAPATGGAPEAERVEPAVVAAAPREPVQADPVQASPFGPSTIKPSTLEPSIVQPDPVESAPADFVRPAPVRDEPRLVEVPPEPAGAPELAEEAELEPEPAAEPAAPAWAREDTREFEPISVPELAEDTIEPLQRLRLDKPAQGEPRREARPTRASRDFDWGE